MRLERMTLLVACALFASIVATPSAHAQGATTGAAQYAAIMAQANTSAVNGTTYVSPTYGYSLSWNESWTVDNELTDGTNDYLRLNNGVVLVDLFGGAWDPAGGSCFDRQLSSYEQDPDYSNIRFATDNASAVPGIWEITGILTMTYTDDEDGSVADYIDYLACSRIPNQDAIVSLEQFVQVANFRTQLTAMDDLRGSFVMNTSSIIAEETPTSTGTEVSAETPTSVSAQTSAVVDNTYTSPSYGYRLSWDETWTVAIEDSDDCGDFLRIASDRLTADLYAVDGESTPAECLNDVLLYYQNDPLYSNVDFVTDEQDQPLITEEEGRATALITFTITGDDGASTESYDHATCVSLTEQGAEMILEIYMAPADFLSQVDAITALRKGLELPSEIDAELQAIDEFGSAGFFLSPLDNSGVNVGQGTIWAEAGQVFVSVIAIGGVAGDVVAIHRGACETINPLDEPEYIVGELNDSGVLREEMSVQLSLFLSGEPYSVVIYAAGEDFSQPLACGEIEE